MASAAPRRARPARPRGFALLIVLWTLVMLALIGGTITAAGRSEAQLAANLRQSAETEAAADGAVAAALFHLLAQNGQHWVADGTPHRLAIGPAAVTVTITDDDGMLDLNQAPPPLIAAVLRQLGLDDPSAQTLANAIADWRSPTDAGLLPQYSAEGRIFGPPHENFQSAAEVGLVVGMTPALTARLVPHLDPFIESTPDPSLADPVVAAAVTDAVKRDHITLDPGSADGPTVLRIIAAASNGTDRYTRSALVRFDATGNPPYLILEWRQG